VVVTFTRDERDVARLDIAVGPCVASPGRKRPLVGVTNQLPGHPVRYEKLFSILVRDPVAEPWATVKCRGRGCLYVFGDTFVNALVELNMDGLRRQTERPRDYDWMFERDRAVLEQWMPTVSWPLNSASVPPEATELAAIAAWARVARERGRRLYCWSGPGFNPWVTPERIARLTS
jgi:hypothetical protein